LQKVRSWSCSVIDIFMGRKKNRMSTRSSPVTRGSASASLSPSSDHSALVQRFDALSAQVDNLTSNLQTLVTTLSSRGVPISPLAGNPPSDPPPASPDTPASVSFSDSIPSQPDPVAPSPPTAAIPGSFTPPAFDQPQPLPSQPSASSDESRLSLVPLFLGPVFDPRHPPDDSIFLAYSWFCPYFAEQVSLHFNADLTIDSSVASCLHPFARIISVTKPPSFENNLIATSKGVLVFSQSQISDSFTLMCVTL